MVSKILVSVILLMTVSQLAETQTLRDHRGASVGRIDQQGVVRDATGKSIGRIDTDGSVRDESGRLMGRIDGQSRVRDETGRLIGRIDNGRVRGAAGLLGMVFSPVVPAEIISTSVQKI